MADLRGFDSEESSVAQVKKGLEKVGFTGRDLDKQLQEYEEQHRDTHRRHIHKLNSLFGLKEFLDRVAYGFGATQFITIFFFLTGAPAFLVGVINGIKDLLGGVFSSFLHQYAHVQSIGKNFISQAGIIFGFSFLGLVLAIRLQSPPLFAVFVLIGSVGVVAYGELHLRLFEKSLSYEKRSSFLKRLSGNGLLITALIFVASAYVIDTVTDGTLMVGNFSIPLAGYFIVFELAAICFILSGFVLSKIPDQQEKVSYSLWQFIGEYFSRVRKQASESFTSTTIGLLFFGQLFTGVVQSLGASFYGYYIYLLFQDSLYGPFLNVSIVFGIAILASFFGPKFTTFVQRQAGLAPMFVFGTLLVAIMPMILVYNHHYPAIIAASCAMVIGASTLGVAQGLLTRKLLRPSQRRVYLQAQNAMLVIPFLILVPLGAYIADAYSFELLFRILLYVLVGLVVPLYLILVFISQKRGRL